MRIINAAEQRPWTRRCPTCGHGEGEPDIAEVVVIAPPVQRRIGPTCGKLMPQTGEMCARKVGHADSHRSRWVMDDEAMRRAGRRPTMLERA